MAGFSFGVRFGFFGFVGFGIGGVCRAMSTARSKRSQSSDFSLASFLSGEFMAAPKDDKKQNELFDDIWNLDHEPSIAVALGNMVVAWAHAEAGLSLALASISGMEPNMAILGFYRIPTFESRVKVIRAISAEWEPKKLDKDAILECVDRLGKLSKTRNHWVHGIWSKSRVSGKTVTFDLRAPDGPSTRQKPVKAADIETHVATVQKVAKRLHALLPPT